MAIYDECSRILYQEIDYLLEGKNADLFRENFKDVSWVKVPRVYWELASSEVLVLEYCPGEWEGGEVLKYCRCGWGFRRVPCPDSGTPLCSSCLPPSRCEDQRCGLY